MTPKKERLKRSDWKEVSKKRPFSSFTTSFFSLKQYTSENPYYSVVVSSKHEKSAVKRNKTRRRIYTLCKKYFKKNTSIIYVTKKAYTATYEELDTNFKNLINKNNKES